MCKISQLAEKNTGQLAIRRAYRTGALFFIIRAYCIALFVAASLISTTRSSPFLFSDKNKLFE